MLALTVQVGCTIDDRELPWKSGITVTQSIPTFGGWDFRGEHDPLTHRSRDGKKYYVGAFSNSEPKDVSHCGTREMPCATLQYWNQNRRSVLRPGDTVRLAPGSYVEPGGTHHCILLDQFAIGVTYEGRTANDEELNDHESVHIDLSDMSTDSYAQHNPCVGNAISGVYARQKKVTYHDVIIRDLKFSNSNRTGVHISGHNSTQPVSDITLDRIQITKSQQGAAMFGRFSSSYDPVDIDCANGGRDVRNIRIVDSEFSFNRGFPGGISFACVDGVTVERSSVHDVCDLDDCSRCETEGVPDDGVCDDRDGISGSGAINVVVRQCEVYNVGEDGIDFGGHPIGKSHHIVIEGNSVHDNPASNIKSAGARYVIVRNNTTWGNGTGFSSYSSPHHVSVYHNTFTSKARGLMAWQYLSESSFANNIFYSTGNNNGVNVWLDIATTNDSIIWDYNVISNKSPIRSAIGEFQGSENNLHGCDDSANSFEPPALPCVASRVRKSSTYSGGRRPSTQQGLAYVQVEADAGAWFGRGTAANDRWGHRVRFVNEDSPSKDNLKLAKNDRVARHTGGFFMRAKEAGSGTVVNVVGVLGSADPRNYFLSPHSFRGASGDTILIEGGGTVTITDMTDSTISFTPAVSWTSGANIHFPWTGAAPDRGVLH